MQAAPREQSPCPQLLGLARRLGRARAGFTLIEVLVTILIMSGLLVAMSQLLTSARRVRDEIHNMVENQLAGPAILDLIERDLRALLVYNRPQDALLRVTERTLSNTDADTIDFVTTGDARLLTEAGGRFVRPDWNEVGYRFTKNVENDDFLVMFRREGFGADDYQGESFDEGRYSFLHDRVRSFSIIVYEEDGEDAEELYSWGDDDEKSGLPTRLVIELTIENAQRIHREALLHQRAEDMLVTYTRVIRVPEVMRLAASTQARPFIPDVPKPVADNASAAGGGPPDGLSSSAGPGSGGFGGGAGGDLSSILGGG